MGLLVLGGMLWLAARDVPPPVIESVQVTSSTDGDKAVPLEVTLPYSCQITSHERLLFDIQLRFRPSDNARLHIKPEGCVQAIRINDTLVPRPRSSYRRCFSYGFAVDLTPYLRDGPNRLQIAIYKRFGQIGMSLESARSAISASLRILAAWVVLMCFVARVTRCFAGDVVTCVAFSAIWLIYLTQFYSTSPVEFSYDLPVHTKYIGSLTERSLPHRSFGPAAAHNPLYYLCAAVAHKAATWLGGIAPLPTHLSSKAALATWLGANDDSFVAIRHLSLVLFLGFSLFGVMTLKRVFSSPVFYYMALIAFLSWPLGFTIPGRINDDVAVYCLLAAMLYYLTQWDASRSSRHLSAAILFCALLIVTKGGGMLYVAILATIVAYRLFAGNVTIMSLATRSIIASIVLLGVAAMANVGWSQINGTNLAWFVPKATDASVNGIWNFIGLDYINYFKIPFVALGTPGREFFWNVFPKSLLFGEFAQWEFWRGARIIAVLLLVMLVYSGVSTLIRIVSRGERSEDIVLPVVVALFLIAGLMYFRFRYPIVFGAVGTSSNARYIYNVILPLTVLFVKAIEWNAEKGRRVTVAVGMATGIGFACLSIAFQAVNAYAMFESFAP